MLDNKIIEQGFVISRIHIISAIPRVNKKWLQLVCESINHPQGIAMKQYQHLSNEERLYIDNGLRAGKTKKQIADELGRSPSTITREVRRNMWPSAKIYTHYWACYWNRWRKRCHSWRISQANSKIDDELGEKIIELVKLYLSPEQISIYLKSHCAILLSHETIYRFIYSDKNRKKELKPFLRQGRKCRRKAYGSGARADRIPNRVCISKRPKVVEKKLRIGDWECDTIFGSDRKSALVTIVERKSLYTVIAAVNQRTSENVCSAIIRLLKPISDKVKTITFDNGSEFIRHETVKKKLGTKNYFAHPYSSWERGISENVNGLIRQFFPKGKNFKDVDTQSIKRVMWLLNNRPRKSRRNLTPNQILNKQFVPLI